MPTLDNFSLGNYGLGGPPEKYATGVFSSTSGTIANDTFKEPYQKTSSYYYLQINQSFGFEPKVIVIYTTNPTDPNGLLRTIFIRNFKNSRGYSYVNIPGRSEMEVSTTSNSYSAYATATGFRLPVSLSSISVECTWEVFG